MNKQIKIWILMVGLVLLISLLHPHIESERRETTKIFKVGSWWSTDSILKINNNWEIIDYECSSGIERKDFFGCRSGSMCVGDTCSDNYFCGGEGYCKIRFKKTYYDLEWF